MSNQSQAQTSSEDTKPFTLVLSLPDGTPLPGVCLTFTQDFGPGVAAPIIATCTTDEQGYCTVQAPPGIINVNFGNTQLGGIPLDNALQSSTNYLIDAAVGGISFYFIGDNPAEAFVVASVDDNGFISMEHATQDGEGNLTPLPVRPGDDSFGIPPFVDPYFPAIYNTTPPEGSVTVRFYPLALRTTAAYDRAYCYYATRGSGYARVPSSSRAFIPGYGRYFDISTVLNGDAVPTQILTAGVDNFDISMQCWGWRGDSLLEIGVALESIPSEEWLGQILTLETTGFSLDFKLHWFGLDTEPVNPVLPEIEEGEDYTTAPHPRFNPEIISPRDVTLTAGKLIWAYPEEENIGGFRIYRKNYLIGSTAPTVRSWSGDGLRIADCGDPLDFKVTAFAGGQESLPSAPVITTPVPCDVSVTVQFQDINIYALEDCDGTVCGGASESYGYFSINGHLTSFGRQVQSPQYIGIQSNAVYGFNNLLAPFGGIWQMEVNLRATDALTIEVVLFDHDENTSDDLLCSWSLLLPPRSAAEWQTQDGRLITLPAVPGEGECLMSIRLGVEVVTQ